MLKARNANPASAGQPSRDQGYLIASDASTIAQQHGGWDPGAQQRDALTIASGPRRANGEIDPMGLSGGTWPCADA